MALLSIPVTWWAGVLTYGRLLGVALAIELSSVVFDVGNATYLPRIVNKETLISRNSLISGTHAVASTGGSSLASAIVQLLGPVIALLVDALRCVASALMLQRLPDTEPMSDSRQQSAREIIGTG